MEADLPVQRRVQHVGGGDDLADVDGTLRRGDAQNGTGLLADGFQEPFVVHHDQPFVQQLHDRGLFAQQFAQADLLGDGVGGGLHPAACMVVKTFARDGNVEDAEEIGLGIENGRGGTIPDMIVGAVVFRADKLNGGRAVQAGSDAVGPADALGKNEARHMAGKAMPPVGVDMRMQHHTLAVRQGNHTVRVLHGGEELRHDDFGAFDEFAVRGEQFGEARVVHAAFGTPVMPDAVGTGTDPRVVHHWLDYSPINLLPRHEALPLDEHAVRRRVFHRVPSRLDQSIPIRRAFSAGRHQRRAKERSFPPRREKRSRFARRRQADVL